MFLFQYKIIFKYFYRFILYYLSHDQFDTRNLFPASYNIICFLMFCLLCFWIKIFFFLLSRPLTGQSYNGVINFGHGLTHCWAIRGFLMIFSLLKDQINYFYGRELTFFLLLSFYFFWYPGVEWRRQGP